ncbi:unnamed protein product [Phyllotreta striolata]|uniref:Uncharacterized protein n=1 Tax=Phyllotreta striolata TaxID=444603 RepID=A0A9N9TZK8_PHYSR|nr:unnamed protein product [Phyllotreta striolata]
MYNLTIPGLAYKVKEFNRIVKTGKGGNSKKNRSKHSITFHTKSRHYQSIKCFLQSTYPAKPSAKIMMLHEASKKNAYLFNPPYQATCTTRFQRNQSNKSVKTEPNFLSPLSKHPFRQCRDKGLSWDSWNRLDANKDLLDETHEVKSLRDQVSSFLKLKRSPTKTTINIASSKSDNPIIRSSRRIKRALSWTSTNPCRNRHTKNTPETDEKNNTEPGVLNPIRVALASMKTNIGKQMKQLKSKYLKISDKKIDVKQGNYPFINQEFLTGKTEKPKRNVSLQNLPEIELKLDVEANRNRSSITEESIKCGNESHKKPGRDAPTILCKLTANSIKEEIEVKETPQLKLTWKTKAYKNIKKHSGGLKTTKQLPKVELEDVIVKWRKNSLDFDPCIKVKSKPNIDSLDFRNISRKGRIIVKLNKPEATNNTKRAENKSELSISGVKNKESKTAIPNRNIIKFSKYKVRPVKYKNSRLKEVLKSYQIKPGLIDFESADKEYKFVKLSGDSPKLDIPKAGSKIESIVPKVRSIADVSPKSCKNVSAVIKSDVCPKLRTNEDIVPKVLKSKISPKPCLHVNAVRKIIKPEVSPKSGTNENVPKVLKSEVSPKPYALEKPVKKLTKSEVSASTRSNENVVLKELKSKISSKSCTNENVVPKVLKSEVSPKSCINEKTVSKVIKSEVSPKPNVHENAVKKVIKSEVSPKSCTNENNVSKIIKSEVSPSTRTNENVVVKAVKSEVSPKSCINENNVSKVNKSEVNLESRTIDHNVPKLTKDKTSLEPNVSEENKTKNITQTKEKINDISKATKDPLIANKSESPPITHKQFEDKESKDILEKTEPNASVAEIVQYRLNKPKINVPKASPTNKDEEKRVKDFVGSPITHKSLNINDTKEDLFEKKKFMAILTMQSVDKTESRISDITNKQFKNNPETSTINYMGLNMESTFNEEYREILEMDTPKINLTDSLITNEPYEEIINKSKSTSLNTDLSGVNETNTSPITCKLDDFIKSNTSLVDFKNSSNSKNYTYNNQSEINLVNYRNQGATKAKSKTDLIHLSNRETKSPFHTGFNAGHKEQIRQQNLSRITLRTLELDSNDYLIPELPCQPEANLKPAKVIDNSVDLNKANVKEEDKAVGIVTDAGGSTSSTKFLKCKYFKYKNKGDEIDKKLKENAEVSRKIDQKNVSSGVDLLNLVEETSNNVEKLLKKIKEVNSLKSEDDLLQVEQFAKKEETIPFNQASGELLKKQELILENLRNILVKIEEVKSEYANTKNLANIKGEKQTEQKTKIQSKLDVIEDTLKVFLTNISDSSFYHVEGNFRIKKTSPTQFPPTGKNTKKRPPKDAPPAGNSKATSTSLAENNETGEKQLSPDIPAKRQVTGKEHWLTITHEHLRKIPPNEKLNETKNFTTDTNEIRTKPPPGSLMYFYLLEADTGDATEVATTKCNKIEAKGTITKIIEPKDNAKKKSRASPVKPIYNEKKTSRQLPDLTKQTPKGTNQSKAEGTMKKGLSGRKRRGFIDLRRFLRRMPRRRRKPNNVEGESKGKHAGNPSKQIERVLRKYKLKEEVTEFSGVSLPDLEMNRRKLDDNTKKSSFYERLDEQLFSSINRAKDIEENPFDVSKMKENWLFDSNNSMGINEDSKSKLFFANRLSTNRAKSLNSVRFTDDIEFDFLWNKPQSSVTCKLNTQNSPSKIIPSKEETDVYDKIMSDETRPKEPIGEAETLFQILYNNVIGNLDFVDDAKTAQKKELLSDKPEEIKQTESASLLNSNERSIGVEFEEKREDETDFRWDLVADKKVLPIEESLKNKESFSNGETPNAKREFPESWKVSD